MLLRFLGKVGFMAFLLSIVVIVGFFGIIMLAPYASSEDITLGWVSWVAQMANNWPVLLGGITILAVLGAIVEIDEERER